jgi:hypothetical protein
MPMTTPTGAIACGMLQRERRTKITPAPRRALHGAGDPPPRY